MVTKVHNFNVICKQKADKMRKKVDNMYIITFLLIDTFSLYYICF